MINTYSASSWCPLENGDVTSRSGEANLFSKHRTSIAHTDNATLPSVRVYDKHFLLVSFGMSFKYMFCVDFC